MQNHGTPMNGAMMNGQQPRMRNPMQGNRTDELNALNIFTNYLTRQQSQVQYVGWQQVFPQRTRLASLIQMQVIPRSLHSGALANTL